MLDEAGLTLLAWSIGLIGAAFGIISIYYMHKAYWNMKGGKFSRAMQKIGVGTVFVIACIIFLGLRSSHIIPLTFPTAVMEGSLALCAGFFYLVGYRELSYLTEP